MILENRSSTRPDLYLSFKSIPFSNLQNIQKDDIEGYLTYYQIGPGVSRV